MARPKDITIIRADPRQPEISALIELLDDYMLALYPAESTHRIDLTTLASETARFYSALRQTTVVGLSLIHISEPRDRSLSRMPSSA